MHMSKLWAAGKSPAAQVARGDPHMKKPLLAVLSALVISGAGMAPAVAAPVLTDGAAAKTVTKTATPTVKAVNFAGTVALSNCSGSVIRFPNSADTDPALVMTNGHCLETGFPGPGEVIVDQASSRTFSLLNSAATKVGTLR